MLRVVDTNARAPQSRWPLAAVLHPAKAQHYNVRPSTAMQPHYHPSCNPAYSDREARRHSDSYEMLCYESQNQNTMQHFQNSSICQRPAGHTPERRIRQQGISHGSTYPFFRHQPTARTRNGLPVIVMTADDSFRKAASPTRTIRVRAAPKSIRRHSFILTPSPPCVHLSNRLNFLMSVSISIYSPFDFMRQCTQTSIGSIQTLKRHSVKICKLFCLQLITLDVQSVHAEEGRPADIRRLGRPNENHAHKIVSGRPP